MNERPSGDRPLAGRTAFVSGSTRGIGKAIALRLARAGANIGITGKTGHPHTRLDGTIFSAAEEVVAAGAQALPLRLDVRHESEIEASVREAVRVFGGIDLLIHNAGAIDLRGIDELPAKKLDLLHGVNVRGTYLLTRAALPFLRRSEWAHVVALAPPLHLGPEWFAHHLGYTLSKYGMSLVVYGLAERLRGHPIAVNALWPRTLIATAAIEYELGGPEQLRRTRHPRIVSDAVYHIVTAHPGARTGCFLSDEEVLLEAGVTDLDRYAVDPSSPLEKDIFID